MLLEYFNDWGTTKEITSFVIGILGCALHPFFFTYHLFIATLKSKRLFATIYSLTKPLVSILLLLMLYFVLEFLFAVIGYMSFPGDFAIESCFKDDPTITCDTCRDLVGCFIFTLDQTFKNDGGVGGGIKPAYEPEDGGMKIEIDYWRILFDFLFGFIIVQILVQLISGIIIDVFKELRADMEKKEEDLKTSCIICGQSSEDIEKTENFDQHVMKNHNIRNYIMFMMYLKYKPAINYNGTESYIYEQIENGEISWLPYSM